MKSAGMAMAVGGTLKEKPTYVRFLVSNSAAGSVIGKGGSTIIDFESQSGARIQLSGNHEFFPGTTDRIIMVSGTINEILRVVELIFSKLLSELHRKDDNDAEPKKAVRLIVSSWLLWWSNWQGRC